MATAKKSITKVSHKTANTRKFVNKTKQPLYLYKISIDDHDYDTYDSAVVAAYSPKDARTIHPGNYDGRTHIKDGRWMGTRNDGVEYDNNSSDTRSWVSASNLSDISVQKVGMAGPKIKRGVICASYNAG